MVWILSLVWASSGGLSLCSECCVWHGCMCWTGCVTDLLDLQLFVVVCRVCVAEVRGTVLRHVRVSVDWRPAGRTQVDQSSLEPPRPFGPGFSHKIPIFGPLDPWIGAWKW